MTVDIEKLKALALAAAPGPWQWWTSNSTLRLTGADGKDGGVLYGYVHSGVGDVSCSEPNRAFIAAANPATVLELIAEVERLRAIASGQAPVSKYVVGQAQANAVRGFAQAIVECGIVPPRAISAVFLDYAEKCARGVIDAAIATSKDPA